MPTIWFWPNPDAGTGEMADSLRHIREQHPELTAKMRFITNVPADEFIALLAHASCLVGNSSAGIKECSYPRHAGGEHRRATAGAAARRARHARRLRRRRDWRSDRHAARARPLRALAHLFQGRTPARRSSTCWRRASCTRRSGSSMPELIEPDEALIAPAKSESPRHHHGPRRIQGHSRQEPEAAGGQAAARPHHRAARRAARSIA